MTATHNPRIRVNQYLLAGLLIATATDGFRHNYDKARIMSIFYVRQLYLKVRINYGVRVANCELFQ